MDYTRHTPLLFLPWQLAQHSSRAYPQSSSSEHPKRSDEPPVPTGIAMKLLEGLGVCVAPGQLLLWGNSSDCKLMLSLLNWPMQQGAWVSLLFSRAWLLRASRFGHLIQRNLLGRAQLLYAFLHKQQWNLHWYISASYPGWPMFVMPSKLNFWLLKAFLKSPSEFSDHIFHYLIKAVIAAKECLECQKAWDAHGECQHAAGTGSSHELWDSLST